MTALEVAKMYNAPLETVEQIIKTRFAGTRKDVDEYTIKFVQDDLNEQGFIEGLTNEQRISMGEEILSYEEPCTDRTVSKHFIIGVNTWSKMGCRSRSAVVEKYIIDYSLAPDSNIEEAKKSIDSGYHGKMISLNLHESTYKIIEGLCHGKRLATAIIELAIWRYAE